jgi:hypothetical protein
VLFLLLAVLLAVRRLSGAVAQPIAGPILIPLAAAIAAASVIVRLWMLPARRASQLRFGICDWLVLVVPSLALAILLVAVITPGTNWLAALAALLFAGLIERVFWRHVAVMLRPREAPATSPPRSNEAAADEPAADESYPANLLQQIIRTREESGEAIHAVLRAEFQPGEQMQVLHVAFCPPLDEAPQLEAFIAGAIDADVKVTAAYSFGARLEVQLALPAAEATNVLVELTGQSSCRSRQDGSSGADPP